MTWQRSSVFPRCALSSLHLIFFGENDHENPLFINGSDSAQFAQFTPGQCRHIQLTVRCATQALFATGQVPVEDPFYANV